ncbi:unnamed protein product [Dovyalis caffra]|uniref:Uncharacterized protein n=1 Tax=Dovyalis caffra TaxID=77055 RepID=A0AAV1SND8_9ROSI|nr:unnamed protein product [Dovyalis caffra]
MLLRGPAMNRSCNRENPDILIVMIAEKQIMRGGEDDKERERMGPQKPAREMSGTAPKNYTVLLLYIVDLVHTGPSSNCKNVDPCSPLLHSFIGMKVFHLYTTKLDPFEDVVTTTKQARSHRYLNEIVHAGLLSPVLMADHYFIQTV